MKLTIFLIFLLLFFTVPLCCSEVGIGAETLQGFDADDDDGIGPDSLVGTV